MSDDVFAIRTTFQDVAELGQGYVERADGERILLPLPVEVGAGEGVRFIVYLTDGTPAFAGAGRSVQVSDQGEEVPAESRYETLIDALVFDERSQPVYDYIVAVRQMAYADLGAAAEAEAEVGEEAVLESDEPPARHEALGYKTDPAPEPAINPGEDEPTRLADLSSMVESQRKTFSDVTPAGDLSQALSQSLADFSSQTAAAPAAAAEHEAIAVASQPPTAAEPEPEAFAPSYNTEEIALPAELSSAPLPRGMLRRPAISAHWVPAAPKRPQQSPSTGLFRYPAGTLPVPKHPPRPELDPAYRIQPAPSANAH
jgi:hypothetical protein